MHILIEFVLSDTVDFNPTHVRWGGIIGIKSHMGTRQDKRFKHRPINLIFNLRPGQHNFSKLN